MKKRYIFMIAICAILSFLVSCDGSINGMFFEHKVTFEYDNGDAAVVKKVKHGETVDKPAEPTKADYAFVNWTTDKDGTKGYDFAAPVTGDITLYAQWIELYTVTFYDGEEEKSTYKCAKGQTAKRPDEDLMKNDYAFIGWTNEKDSKTLFNFNTQITSALKLYAIWEQATSSLKYDKVKNSDGTIFTDELTVGKDSSTTTLSGKIYIPAKIAKEPDACVREITADAFTNCGEITHIYIPQKVSKINSGAFDNCDKLQTIYFGGTFDEFYIACGRTYEITSSENKRNVTVNCRDGEQTSVYSIGKTQN